MLADVGGAAQDTYEETILPLSGAIWSAADVISALVRRAVLPVAGLVLLVVGRLVAVLLRWVLRVVRGGAAAAAEVPLVGTMPAMQQRRHGWLWGGRSSGQGHTVALPELVVGRSRRGWLWGGAEAGTAAALVEAGRKVLAVLPCYVFEELKAATGGFGAAALLPVGSGYRFSSAMDTAALATGAAAGRAAAAGPAAAAGTVGPGGLALCVPVYVARDVQGMPVAVAVVAVGDEQRLRRFCALAHLLSQLRHPSLLLFMGASVGLAAPRAAYPMVVQRQQGQQEEQRQDAAVGCLVFELLPGVRTLEAALAPASSNGSAAASGRMVSTGGAGTPQTLAAAAVPAAAGAGGTPALDSMPPLSFAARLQVASTLASTVHHLLMRGAVLRPGAAALIDAVLIPQTGPPKINAAALLLLPSSEPQPKAGAVVHAQDAQLAAEAAAVSALGLVLLLLLTGPPLALDPDVALLREVLRQEEVAALARRATQAHNSSMPGSGAGVRSAGSGAGGASGGRPSAAAEDGTPQEEQAAGLLEAALLCLSPDGEAAHGSRTGAMAWLPKWLQWRRQHGRPASAGKPRPFPWGQLLPALAGLAESAAAPVVAAAGRWAGASAPPAMFICPLTHDVMADPVVAADGFVYERAAIQRWLNTGHRRSPMTNVSMATALVPNHSLRSTIMEWRQQQQP